MVGRELLRTQKYNAWAVPLDGSSNIILSTIEKYQRGNSAWVSLPHVLTKGELYCSICNENFPKVLPVHLGRGGGGFVSKCRIRSTKTGGQLSLLDWGGGWAFIGMDVKSVAMVQCQLFPTKF